MTTPKDPTEEARRLAREICQTHIRAPWCTEDYHLMDAIAAALQARDTQAYERGRKQGRDETLSLLRMKLTDGTESNRIRAEAAERIQSLLTETDALMAKGGRP
jgi:hypothetical protein